MSEKNKTRYKSLNPVAEHPYVDDVYDEGDDGIWVELNIPNPADGTHAIHEWKVSDVMQEWYAFLKAVRLSKCPF